MSSQQRLLLIGGLFAAPSNVSSFSVHVHQPLTIHVQSWARTMSARSAATVDSARMSKTALLAIESEAAATTAAKTSATETYLNSLNDIIESTARGASATDSYLNALSVNSMGVDNYVDIYAPSMTLSSIETDPSLAEASAIESTSTIEVNPEEFLNNLSTQLAESANAVAVADVGTPVDVNVDMSAVSDSGSPMNTNVDISSSASASEVIDPNTGNSGLADATSSLAVDYDFSIEAPSVPAEDGSLLSSQLSDLSYGSIVNERTMKATTSTANTALEGMNLNINNKLSEMAAGTSSSINKAASEFSSSLGKLFTQTGESISSSVTGGTKAIATGTGRITKGITNGIVSEKNQIVEGTTSAVNGVVDSTTSTANRITDASLSDFAHNIVKALKFVGTVLYQVTDEILLNVGDTSIANIVQGAQGSISNLINGAITSVTKTITDIGNLSLKQLVEMLIATIIAVSKILLHILNAITQVVSGKEATEWFMMAEKAVEGEAKHLSQVASSTAHDLTHKSLGELGSMVGDFSSAVVKNVLVVGEQITTSSSLDQML